jgi:hypothetical protein
VESRRIAIALFVQRLKIVFVMLIWTIDKFIRPAHAASVYEHFYFWAALVRPSSTRSVVRSYCF